MKAIIVYTDDIAEMAHESCDRVLRFTNLLVVDLMRVDSKRGAHRLKLDVWKKPSQESIWVVDADLWFLQPCTLPEPKGPVVFGNPDNSPLVKEKYKGTSVELGHAINTSLVGADRGCPRLPEAIDYALALQEQRYGTAPLEDEKFFNIAMTVCDLTIARLSTRFNWCGVNPPANAFAVHAASQPNKLDWLRKAVSNHERNSTTPDA